MSDTTTELEVLDEIVDALGGQSGQYETVVPTLQQILALLGGGGGGGGGGYNPALSVGRADALTGADETAQWAQRESTGSGAATVRSVQGAAVSWNQHVKTGSNNWTATNGAKSYTDDVITVTPNGGEGFTFCQVLQNMDIDGIGGHKYFVSMDFLKEDWSDTVASSNYAFPTLFGNWLSYYPSFVPSKSVTTWQHLSGIVSQENDNTSTSFTFRSYGDTYPFSLKNVMVIDLTQMFGSGNEPSTVAEFEAMYPDSYYPYSAPTLKPVQIAGIQSKDAQGGELDAIEWTAQTLRAAGSVRDELTADELVTRVGERAYQSGDESDATVRTDGTTTYYPLATPTTTPISPALPMTYRVQAGGSEAIIVPSGEISAPPILTVAEGESAATLVMDALACIATPDGPVATANHAINTYLTMQGKLYKVTSAIAVGESITPNTNVSETTVMAELIARTA